MCPYDLTGRQIDGLEAAEFAVRIRPSSRGETNVVAAGCDISGAARYPAVIRTAFDQRHVQDVARRIEGGGWPVAGTVGIGAQKRGLTEHRLKIRVGVFLACNRVNSADHVLQAEIAGKDVF